MRMSCSLFLLSVLAAGVGSLSSWGEQPGVSAPAVEPAGGASEAPTQVVRPAEGELGDDADMGDEIAGDGANEEGEAESEDSLLRSPADPSVPLPVVSARPLPDVFADAERVLMEQSEPARLLFLDHDGDLTEEEREEVEEARGHVREALEAAKSLFLAQMALVRVPLSHPDYFMEPEEVEKCLEICEEYLAESFRRDVELLSYSNSFLPPGCVEPSLHSGKNWEQHFSDVEVILQDAEDRLRDVGEYRYEVLYDEGEKQLTAFLDRYLAGYGGEGVRGGEGCDPFTGLHGIKGSVIEVGAPGEEGSVQVVDYGAVMQELIRREQLAWKRYVTAMGNLVTPCKGYRGSASDDRLPLYWRSMFKTRKRFFALLAAGADGIAGLPDDARERRAALLPLHDAYDFGEILTDYARIFRHPRLEGHPWCISFPYASAGFLFLSDSEVLRQFLAAHPEGGETEVRGYQMLESTGEPYERPRRETTGFRTISAPRPDGALEFRQVFHVLECGPSDTGEMMD